MKGQKSKIFSLGLLIGQTNC